MRSHRWFTPWVLVAPALVWLLGFSVWPSINTLRLSFTDAKPLGGSADFAGLRNYTDLLLANSYVPTLTQTQFNALKPMNYNLPKNFDGSSWYLEYTSVWTRNRSSG